MVHGLSILGKEYVITVSPCLKETSLNCKEFRGNQYLIGKGEILNSSQFFFLFWGFL